MCARLHTVQQKPSPWLLGSHNPIPCRSDSEICGFWCLNNQCATLRHQHIAFHQLRITAQGPSRHGIGSHPAVIHNPPCRRRSSVARPWRGEKVSWAPCIRTPSAPSGIWQFFWRWKAPLQRRGGSQSSRLVLCLGRFCLEGMSRWEVGGSWRSGLTATPSWKEISLVLARVLSRFERWRFILFSFYKCFL